MKSSRLKSISDGLFLIRKIANVFIFLISLAFICLAIIDFAYYPTAKEAAQIRIVYRLVWIIFLLDLPFQIYLNYKMRSRRGILPKVITSIILFTTLFPVFFGGMAEGTFFHRVGEVTGSKFYFIFAMLLVAGGNISRSIIRLFDKKTNPALMMASSFSILILLGTFLLLSPRCSVVPISIVDALFTATSAVCVTGLTPLDISTAFTFEGQTVIMFLIQVGGLGVMTLTSFFAVFFMGNVRVSNQLTVKEMISSGTMQSLFSMLMYILGFTLVIESIGAIGIWNSIHGTMGMTLQQEIFFSAFHAISAFCNAGFSILQGNLGNSMVMIGHNSLFIIVSILIIFGGIGFPILVNLKNLVGYHLKKFYAVNIRKSTSFQRKSHLLNVNTKIVLITTLALLIIGTAAMAIFEWNRAFVLLPTADRMTQAFFNAASTRTAGFSSVPLTLFSVHSLLVYMFLMWIGGAAQSTAGGIKVNTFAVAFLSIKSILRSENKVEVFNRELSQTSVSRAYGTIFISVMIISISIFILSFMEPEIPLMNIAFETFSAIGTVGSSLDTTQLLHNPSKLFVAFLMFTGRVGIFTLIVSFMRRKPKKKYSLPKEDIIIS